MWREASVAETIWAVFVMALLGGVLLLLGFCAIAPGVYERREQARLAACHFAPSVRVEIAGHVLDFPAGAHSAAELENDEYLKAERTMTADQRRETGIAPRYAYCLGAPQTAPLAARHLLWNFEDAEALARQVGLAQEFLISLRIRDADWYLRDAPAPVGSATRLMAYDSALAVGRLTVVTEGIGPEGFRISARCGSTFDDRLSCDLNVNDLQTALSYQYFALWIDDREFDGAPLPAEFLDVAHKMRALVGLLAAR